MGTPEIKVVSYDSKPELAINPAAVVQLVWRSPLGPRLALEQLRQAMPPEIFELVKKEFIATEAGRS